MQWPFKTTISFAAPDGNVIRVHYAVSAASASQAKAELEQPLVREEVFGYVMEEVVAATGQEALHLELPEDCVQLLG